jgi:hypothetical protein
MDSNSRVNCMKSRFERLGANALEFDLLSTKLSKPAKPNFIFRRSRTTLALTSNSRRESRNFEEDRQKLTRSSKRESSYESNDLLDTLTCVQTLDTLRLGIIHSHTQPLIESNDKFQRQNSDSKQRGSVIKRTPAFRATTTRLTLVVPNELEDIVYSRNTENDVSSFDKPLDIGYSDTLKKALKQPLPVGPPPKKPPRLFESPVKEDSQFELQTDDILKSKIDFLEHNLQLKTLRTNKENKITKETSSSHNILTSCLCILGSPSEYESSNNGKFDDAIIKTFPKSKNPSEHIYMVPFGHLKDRQQPQHQFKKCDIDKKNEIILVPDSLTTTNNTIANNNMTENGNSNINNNNNNNNDDSLSSSTFSNNSASSFLHLQHQQTQQQHSCPENHNHNEDLHYLVSCCFAFYTLLFRVLQGMKQLKVFAKISV